MPLVEKVMRNRAGRELFRILQWRSSANPAHPRQADTYRGARRNRARGVKPVGNTTPADRKAIWGHSS